MLNFLRPLLFNGELYKQYVSVASLHISHNPPVANVVVCLPNVFVSGDFAPPGANAVAMFVSEYDKVSDPRWQAIKAAEIKASKAEMEAARAEEEAIMAGKEAAKAMAGEFCIILKLLPI